MRSDHGKVSHLKTNILEQCNQSLAHYIVVNVNFTFLDSMSRFNSCGAPMAM